MAFKIYSHYTFGKYCGPVINTARWKADNYTRMCSIYYPRTGRANHLFIKGEVAPKID